MKKILLIIALSLSVVMCKSQSDTKSSVGKDTKNVTNNTSIDKEVNLQKYFNDSNTQGSITIYDYKNKKWIYSDVTDSKRRTLPASTFKIPSSLITIEENAVKDEFEVLKWDGVKRTYEAHNADTDLKDAYKNSTVWFYQEMARRIGKEKFEKYLKEFNYGNQNLSGKEDYFWLDNTLTISPVEQINFLTGLYEEKYPLSKRTYTIVKEIMINEKTDDYVLRAKTGFSDVNTLDIGWFVGYVETKDNVYFFATRLWQDEPNKNKDFLNLRKTITFEVLKSLNIIK
ncbi:MAG: class D beta-lactamase [Sebaldella sp.]|nr:class D beta-lactamase [Sebaldella sp.]